MTSTFATQFISGSPKAMCEHREEKVSCKRLMGDKKGLQRKEKYKRVFRGSIKLIVRIKGDCASMSIARKRNGLKLVVPVQPAKRIGGLCLFLSEMGYHNPMFENPVFIARSPLLYPDMVCSVSEYEIVVERGFVLQAFHTCPKFGFVSCKRIVFMIRK